MSRGVDSFPHRHKDALGAMATQGDARSVHRYRRQGCGSAHRTMASNANAFMGFLWGGWPDARTLPRTTSACRGWRAAILAIRVRGRSMGPKLRPRYGMFAMGRDDWTPVSQCRRCSIA